ncbi:MAG: MFS transporter [Ktedonobacteraceae bacterium]|nr:MFS transporter [Ktedonobacteraceae bacterium]
MQTTTPLPLKSRGSVKISRTQARLIFIALLFINILNYADRYVLPAILRKIQAAPHFGGLGLTDFQAGLIGSSFLLVYAFATLPLGMWADRGVRKNIVALCVGVWSIATVLAGLTINFLQLFVVRSILGIGEAGYAPAAPSLLADCFSKDRRGRVLSYWSAGSLIGSAIGFALGGFIADTLGWRWAFFVVGIPGLLAALLIWRLTEPTRGAFDREEDGKDTQDTLHEYMSTGQDLISSLTQLLRIPTYRVLLAAFTFSFFAIGGTSFWLPSYFIDTFHLSLGKAGLISGLVLVGGGLTGTILGGVLADYAQRRLPEGRLLVATLGFFVGTPLALIAFFLHHLGLVLAMFTIVAIFLSFCIGPLNAVLQDITRPDLRATAVGFSLLCAHILGDASASSIIGLLADLHHHRLGFALLVTGPTALLLAGTVCLIGLRTVAHDMKIKR